MSRNRSYREASPVVVVPRAPKSAVNLVTIGGVGSLAGGGLLGANGGRQDQRKRQNQKQSLMCA